MARPKKVSGIDISEDMDFQRREWTVQRAAWLVAALLLLAGLLGLLGKGPLGEGQAGNPDGALSLKYDRFDRYQAPSQLEISAGPNTSRGKELRLTLNSDYVQRVAIDRIEPEPDAVELAGDTVIYVFKVSDPAQPNTILFQYQFQKFGSASGKLGLEGGPQVEFRQFVYP